jgi:hypothetical protein
MPNKPDAPPFPQPVKISPGCTRWRLSDLEAYEAARAGLPPPPPRDPSSEAYFSDRAVARRYDSSRSSVWRWAALSESEVA